MRATDAIAIATEWVREQGRETTGYRGAWFTGSVCWMHDDEQLNPSSDVDITIIVRADAMPNAKPGKFRHRGILLEVTLAPDTLLDDQDIALNAPIASSIARNRLIDDPEGILVPWFERVGQTFRRRDTIITRIRTQADTIRQRTGSIDSSAPFHRQILWLFPATLATSLPILAELGNPCRPACPRSSRLPRHLRAPSHGLRLRSRHAGRGNHLARLAHRSLRPRAKHTDHLDLAPGRRSR
jgi:hypothetical protein